MSDTVFTSQQTQITAGWANDVNKAVYYSPAYVVGGGTGAAYVAALNAVPSAITDKALLWMYAPATNTAGATLQLVNGPSPWNTALPITQGGSAVGAGVIAAGALVPLVYSAATNSWVITPVT